MIEKYRVHFDQINQRWEEVEASSREEAVVKATKLAMEWEPTADAVILPSGKEVSVEDY